jgi:plastocyanin
MMQITKRISISFLILMVAGLLFGCMQPLNQSVGRGDAEVVILDGAKTIQPSDAEIKIVSYVLSGTGPNGATLANKTFATSPHTESKLDEGAWTFTVKGLNAAGSIVASGSNTATIIANSTVNVSVVLTPVKDGSGTGTFSLSGTIPSSITLSSFTGVIAPSTGGANTTFAVTVSGTSFSYSNSTLPVGSYILTLVASQAAGAWRGVYALRIYQGKTSTLSLNLAADDFAGATINGVAKYYDKAANQYSGISVTITSTTSTDFTPASVTTGNAGSFTFTGLDAGTYIIEAKDPDAVYQPASTTVTIGSNETVTTPDLVLTKAGNHVVIFRDSDTEWELAGVPATVIGDLLETEVGLTEGTGANQYEYKTSSDMAAYAPSLGDVVIIGGDQSQAFYDAYTTNKSKFDTFVNNGGTMYWIACDNGWAEGDFTSSLPGGVTWRDSYEYYIDIVYFQHPITKNFPTQLYGYYASHGGFDNLDVANITGLMVYVKEDAGALPTYIEYRYGLGKVLATTTPLEYYVTNGSTDMPTGFNTTYKDLFKLMLVRSVKYIMGKTVSDTIPASAVGAVQKALQPARSSH